MYTVQRGRVDRPRPCGTLDNRLGLWLSGQSGGREEIDIHGYLFALLNAFILSLAGVVVAVSHAATKLDFFVANDGDDANGGRAAKDALRTLEAVEERVATRPSTDDPLEVTIFVAAGRYTNQTLEWTTARPNLSVSLRPYEGVADGQVVFDGGKVNRQRFFVYNPSKASPAEDSGSVRFSFEGIVIENFCEGISFGDVEGRSTTFGHRVDRLTLRAIGSKYDRRRRVNERGDSLSPGDCYAGIRLAATSRSSITRTRFENIENLPANQTFYRQGPGLLHAIYIATLGQGNMIMNNTFVGFTGSPIRVRDRSNDTVIEGNTFERPLWPEGKVHENPLYAVSEWYCNTAVAVCIEKALKGRRECPSTGTRMAGNRLGIGVRLHADQSQSEESTCTFEPNKTR